MLLRPEIYGACLEIGFHNAEAFFDFPALFIDPDNLINPHVIKVRAYGIETVIKFFFLNDGRIEINHFPGTDLAVFCGCFTCYKPMRIIWFF